MTRFRALLDRHTELRPLESDLEKAFCMLVEAWRADRFVLVCGNGGSAADAEHIVGELMKSMDRRRAVAPHLRSSLSAAIAPAYLPAATCVADRLEGALRALSLTSQTSLITAIANDVDCDMIFAQQVYGYGRPGDVLWVLSTSGNAPNTLLAAITARAIGVRVLALTGADGGALVGLADVCLRVPTNDVAMTQELHRPVYHALCALVQDAFFPP